MYFLLSLHVFIVVVVFVSITASETKNTNYFVNKEIYEETNKRDDHFQGKVYRKQII